ncbi:unnamed protein product [Symbiodinium natans]|uniref:Uncharacterized protein n=1 Tax=Symbiodinium natans TaxID=878477 RepID=A0A812G8K1_9DINO|nr:unnamed protein product [Symbiodinium natans]
MMAAMASLALLLVMWCGCQSATQPQGACAGNSGLGLIQRLPAIKKFELDHESSATQEPAFLPVDGGVGRACRGASTGDNKQEYFQVLSASDIGACKALCEGAAGCVGIEYHTSGRCEVWTKKEGIQASIELTGYTCLRYGTDGFLPVDGGSDRVCRGGDIHDNNPAHYNISSGTEAQCKALCLDNPACVGIEHAGTRCEVWFRPEGIQASQPGPGSKCLKLEFTKVEASDNMACRGASRSDNNPNHYVLKSASSLGACKELCRTSSACVGIEYIGTRCEVWTRPEGIEAGFGLTGYTCLKYHGGLKPPPSTKQERDARFLIQATFGPTLASINGFNISYQTWIERQMALPPSYHREYYRKRVNPRPVLSASSMASGSPLSRCNPGSRWVNHVILRTDKYRKIKVQNDKIYIDDFFRSDVDPNYLGNGLRQPDNCSDIPPKDWVNNGYTCENRRYWVDDNCIKDEVWVEEQYCQKSCFEEALAYENMDCSPGWAGLNYEGYICSIHADETRAWVKLNTRESCEGESTETYMLNPGVWKANPDITMTQTLAFEIFRPGVLILKEPPSACNLGTIVQSSKEKPNQFYMLEERLELLENTLENPAATGVTGGKCPTVARTFLNEHSCRLLPGCLPLGQEKLSVALTTQNLEKFFSVGGRYVFQVSGLRTAISPCGVPSRWKKCSGCTASTLAAEEIAQVAAAIEEASEQGDLRDIDVSCSGVPAESVIPVGSDLFQHVHKDEGSVYDFTDWTLQHPGGAAKIKQFTGMGYELVYPSWHPMDRWDKSFATQVIQPNYVGKFGSHVLYHNLPATLQTEDLAQALGAAAEATEYSAVCGSPQEVANDPSLGHLLSFKHGGTDDVYFDQEYHFWWNRDRRAKSMVWTMQALYAEDQLRQRMAWALSQIYVCSVSGGGYAERAESWTAYYDIFVRNAFGNLRDILRQVTYNPIMGGYLTFKGNRAFDETGRFPDENYAREIMQLFSIGLWKLNTDGSQVLDSSGQPIPTYDNEHIMNFARVFTGFDEQPNRGNYEYQDNRNRIDPMRMRASWHDKYPKPDLDGNYLGDGYPLCSDLADQAFLAKGARFTFVGAAVHLDPDLKQGALELDSSSGLYQALCFQSGGKCNYNLTVELDQAIPCTGKECTTYEVQLINVSGGLYEYLEPTCVNMFFFNGRITRDSGRRWGWSQTCRDPEAFVGGIACCDGCKNATDSYMRRRDYTCENAETTYPAMFTDRCNNSDWWTSKKYCQLACWEKGVGYGDDDCSYGPWHAERVCNYDQERVRLSTAEKVCAAKGMKLCDQKLEGYGCLYDSMQVWTKETCTHEVIVFDDGNVASNYTSKTRNNRFHAQWKNGFPQMQNGQCPSGCTPFGSACSCSMSVEVRAVFTSTPTASQLQALKLGAHPPATACTSSCSGPVKAYQQNGVFDAETVFEHKGAFYSNKESVVVLPGGFEFRNPPAFMPNVYMKEHILAKHALAEVEALLDHLFNHPNVAPFISYRLIQRFGNSNPSSAYVHSVADAFRKGSYGGKTYSGKYGDLAATAAAILLHPEARSPTLPADGSLREPYLKLIHVLRALEYKDTDASMPVLKDLQDSIGQHPYKHPSVFSYYLPDHKPDSFPEGKVAPEFQIFTPPMIINFLNGISSLVDHGLGDCDRGFGERGLACSQGQLTLGQRDCLQPTVDQLDLLLTGGRLHNQQFIRAAYEEANGEDRYKVATKAVLLSPEFNTIGTPMPKGPRPPTQPKPEEEPGEYKAAVMVFLNGGADSYNMLVPLDCPLYDEYRQVRGNIALETDELHAINTSGQDCSKFGIHHELNIFKELYDNKELAFAANVGSLVESLDKAAFSNGFGERCIGLFSHSDQQRAAQTLTCQSPTAASKGAGGRLADALASGSKKLKTMSFSLVGSQPWPQGLETNAEIINDGEPIGLRSKKQLQVVIDNITSIKHGNMYCEEYSQKLTAALDFNEQLTSSLRNAELATSFSTDNRGLTRQLREVARLIASRAERKVERDLFFVQIGGFDNHQSVERNLANRFDEVDHGFKRFVAEMKAQNMFDKVVMATHSDFARTLTPNSGAGSDHAWGGNYVIVGGGIQGGKVFNDFPASLLPGGAQDAGRGRLIPKYPFENMMLPIAQWMGLEADQESEVFPNLKNFNSSHFISQSALFV